jgi:hypothetical protein
MSGVLRFSGLDERLTRSEFIDLLAFLQAQTSRASSQSAPPSGQGQSP